jgi:glycosyltransferase involved in cell wall biosynthesis
VRVLFLNPIARMGGAEQSLLDLFASLRAEVALGLLTLENGPLVDAARSLGIPTEIIPTPEDLMQLGDFGATATLRTVTGFIRRATRQPRELVTFLRRLGAAVSAFAPDIIHSNGIKTHLLSSVIAPAGPALVWHVRDFLSSRPLVRKALPPLSRRVSAAFAISRAVEQDLRGVVPELPVAVVYNAVDLDRFKPRRGDPAVLDGPAGLGAGSEETVRIGLVATYARWKGHRVFLEAAAQAIAGSTRPLRFYVIGGPIYRGAGAQITESELREWVARLGLTLHVGIVPFLKTPEHAFNALDLVISANTAPEPFGRTIVEAMASGVPVICAPAVGALEALPADSVYRLEVLTSTTLATAILQLCSQPETRAMLRRRGLDAAAAMSRERLRERVLELYRCLRPQPESPDSRSCQDTNATQN